MPIGSYTDGQTNTVAWREHLDHLLAGSISRIQTTPSRLAQLVHQRSTSAAISGVSGRRRSSTSWTSGRTTARRAQQVRQALLPGDPADEDHVRPVGVDAVPLQDVGVGVRRYILGVDAVVHDVDPVRVDAGVRREDVVAHARLTRDDRVGRLERGPLGPATTARSRRRAARPSTAAAAPG